MTKKQISEWEAETDVSLFQALRGHKPIGIGKHFHMLCIMGAFWGDKTTE